MFKGFCFFFPLVWQLGGRPLFWEHTRGRQPERLPHPSQKWTVSLEAGGPAIQQPITSLVDKFNLPPPPRAAGQRLIFRFRRLKFGPLEQPPPRVDTLVTPWSPHNHWWRGRLYYKLFRTPDWGPHHCSPRHRTTPPLPGGGGIPQLAKTRKGFAQTDKIHTFWAFS